MEGSPESRKISQDWRNVYYVFVERSGTPHNARGQPLSAKDLVPVFRVSFGVWAVAVADSNAISHFETRGEVRWCARLERLSGRDSLWMRM